MGIIKMFKSLTNVNRMSTFGSAMRRQFAVSVLGGKSEMQI